MTTYISNDGKNNLLSEQYLMQKFKEICPDVNPDVLDPDLFEDIIIYTMYTNIYLY